MSDDQPADRESPPPLPLPLPFPLRSLMISVAVAPAGAEDAAVEAVLPAGEAISEEPLAEQEPAGPAAVTMVEAVPPATGREGELPVTGREVELLENLGRSIQSLEGQFARMGKEYFKANVQAEARQKSLEQLLEQQRETELRRERELAELRERVVAERDRGQRDVIEALLPVVDGLADALASGERLLAPAGQPLSPGQRLTTAAALIAGSPLSLLTPEAARSTRSWLEGVRLVYERLMNVLSQAGVQPIATEGAPFDPHLHVAIEVEPSTPLLPAGSIVRETRRGFLQGDAVLRYAEVVVSRDVD